MNDNPIILKWFEVTWVTASGRSLVKAEDAGEAKMIASQHAGAVSGRGVLLDGGRAIAHEWLDTKAKDNEPLIFDVEEIASDTAAELKSDMEGG